jgi:hypothetical protein
LIGKHQLLEDFNYGLMTYYVMVTVETLGFNQKSKDKKRFWGIRTYIKMHPMTS